MATPKDFAIAVLNRMGLPVTDDNIVSLVAFVGIEGTWPAGKNPFNSMLRMPGSTSRTPLGVQSYADWASGLEANVHTLAQPNMAGIVAALKQSAPPQDFLRALSDSPWCSDPSTVANRSPKCDMAAGILTQCYCDYAAYDAGALYNNWADRDDSSGPMAAGGGTDWKLLGSVAAILLLGGGVGYWIMTDGGRKPLRL